MDLKEAIETIETILESAFRNTPYWVSGIIVQQPSTFEMAIKEVIREARKSRKYFEQIMNNTKSSQEEIVKLIRLIEKGEENV